MYIEIMQRLNNTLIIVVLLLTLLNCVSADPFDFRSRYLSKRGSATLQQYKNRFPGDAQMSFRRRQGKELAIPTGKEPSTGDVIAQLSEALHKDLIGGGRSQRARGRNVKGRNRKRVSRWGQRRKVHSKQFARSGGGNDYVTRTNWPITLPECATQQVCNAVYVRLNMTQPLCSCPNFSSACSASQRSDDQHTIELRMAAVATTAVTMIKTCEPVWSVRDCKSPRDWSLLALQNTRTAKSHYLVICKCPEGFQLDGPLNHDQPDDAKMSSIRVYGMMCIDPKSGRKKRDVDDMPPFPMKKAAEALRDPTIANSLQIADY